MKELVPLIALTKKRESLGYTQEQLAVKAKISRPLLSNIERGYADPSLKVAGRIAKSLQATVDEIFFARKVRKMNNNKSA